MSLYFLRSYTSLSSIFFLILSLSWSEVEGQLGSSMLWDRYTAGVCFERRHILQCFLAAGSIWDLYRPCSAKNGSMGWLRMEGGSLCAV